MSASRNLNLRISVNVSLDNVLILMAFIRSSHSTSNEISSFLFPDRCSNISLPATERIVLSALNPQS